MFGGVEARLVPAEPLGGYGGRGAAAGARAGGSAGRREAARRGRVAAEAAAAAGETRVQLAGRGLARFPEILLGLRHMVTLNLARNELKEVPAALGGLHSLEKLLLSRNRLVAVPEELGGLRSLRVLMLDGNVLKDIPAALACPARLQELTFEGNAPDITLGGDTRWEDVRPPASAGPREVTKSALFYLRQAMPENIRTVFEAEVRRIRHIRAVAKLQRARCEGDLASLASAVEDGAVCGLSEEVLEPPRKALAALQNLAVAGEKGGLGPLKAAAAEWARCSGQNLGAFQGADAERAQRALRALQAEEQREKLLSRAPLENEASSNSTGVSGMGQEGCGGAARPGSHIDAPLQENLSSTDGRRRAAGSVRNDAAFKEWLRGKKEKAGRENQAFEDLVRLDRSQRARMVAQEATIRAKHAAAEQLWPSRITFAHPPGTFSAGRSARGHSRE